MAVLGTVTKKYLAGGGSQFATQALAEQFASNSVRPGQTIDIEEIDCTVVSQVTLPPAAPTIARVPATSPAAPAATAPAATIPGTPAA